MQTTRLVKELRGQEKVSGYAPEHVQKDIELREMRDFGSNVIQQLGTMAGNNPQMMPTMQLMFSQAGLPPAPSPMGSRVGSRTSSARSSTSVSRAGSQLSSVRLSASGSSSRTASQPPSGRSSTSTHSKVSARSSSSVRMGGAQLQARSTGSERWGKNGNRRFMYLRL